MSMYIWAIDILNQLFIRDSYTQIKFSKNDFFQKMFFKVNILKTFKIPCDCHINPWLSLKRRNFLKTPRIDF